MIRTKILAAILKLSSFYSDLDCFWNKNFVKYIDEICEKQNIDSVKFRRHAWKCTKLIVIFITINITDSNAALWIYGVFEAIK